MTTITNFKNYVQKETDLKLEESLIQLLFEKFFSNLRSSLHPKLLVLGGSPGAGKTHYRKKFLLSPNFHIHDMDEVLIRLPDYQKDCDQSGIKIAFERWWQIAQKIANAMVRFAFRHRYNVIYDRTCGTEESYLDLKAIHETKQYRIIIYGFWVSEETALIRVKKREEIENRTVTPEITKEYLRRFSALWPFYAIIANEAYLLDNNLSFEYPKVYEKIEGGEGVFNLDSYQKFLAPGKEINFNEKFPRLRVVNRYFLHPCGLLNTTPIEQTPNLKNIERKLVSKL